MTWPTAEIAEPPCAGALTNAYELLASEYDDAVHRTTRVLESLSRQGLRRAFAQTRLPVRRLLEIGAGTGALTTSLLETWLSATVLATDPSVNMLAVLTDKLGDRAERLTTTSAGIAEAGAIGRAPDLVAAGLADPFLDEAGLGALRKDVAIGTHIFVTVPSRRWARRERTQRLCVALDITRFRMRDGTVVFAQSLTYDAADLQRLVLAAGFAPLAAGTERSSQIWSRPEICWTLARAV